MDAMQFLSTTAKSKHRPIYVLYGDEDFLKRQTRDKLIKQILDEADPDLAVSTYSSADLEFSAVRNDLETLPFLTPFRIVVLENADEFVTDNRAVLEQYFAKPSSVGVLILELKTFPETTKLAKALPDGAKIVCKAPYASRLPAWCISWTNTQHHKHLDQDAAALIVERVGASMGLLDQELAKVAGSVGNKKEISAEDVERLVGRSKAANVFQIMDAVGNEKPDVALSILEELFADGSDPMGVLAPLTFQLRKLANVGRLTASGVPLGNAMDTAQVAKWDDARRSFEKQLRHLGRRRLEKLSEWLAEINLGLKGGNPLPERVQVERLIVMLARPREQLKVEC
jgi:DNA polymerase-3 subunit delta